MMGYRVAVVGATGAVGREMLKTLAERNFPITDIAAVASGRSSGTELSFGEDRVLKTQNLEKFDFRGWDIALFSPGAAVSAIHAPRAAEAGCVVIDNTSQFRMDPAVPLVVPEVNPGALAGWRKKGIIANPNCSTIQMVLALKPLHDEFTGVGRDLSVGLGRRQRRHGRAVQQQPCPVRERPGDAAAIHQEHRLQRHPAHRRVHG
jgi:aspartate-semialdehyde dehydrogenase